MLLLSARHKEGDDASASLGCEGILIFIHSLYHELLSENWLQRISGRERWKEKKRKMFVVVVKSFTHYSVLGHKAEKIVVVVVEGSLPPLLVVKCINFTRSLSHSFALVSKLLLLLEKLKKPDVETSIWVRYTLLSSAAVTRTYSRERLRAKKGKRLRPQRTETKDRNEQTSRLLIYSSWNWLMLMLQLPEVVDGIKLRTNSPGERVSELRIDWDKYLGGLRSEQNFPSLESCWVCCYLVSALL